MKTATWVCVSSLLMALVTLCVEGQVSSVPTPDVQVTGSDTVEVSWPNVAPGFILQESDSPGDTALWRGVMQTPVLAGGRMKVTRSVADVPVRLFYRIRAKGPNPGLDYLLATQTTSGSWGSPTGTLARDSAAALDALALYGWDNDGFYRGLGAISGLPHRNFDELSRKAVTLGVSGYDVSAQLAELLNGQGAEIGDSGSLSFPGRGWGLARGFGTSTIDTALVLRALQAGGRLGGLAVANEQIAPSATSPTRTFTIPAGATGVLLKIRSVTGGTLRFNLTPPGSGTLYVDIGPGSAPTTITGLPNTAGTWSFQVRNLSAATCKYSAELAFIDSSGFDFFRFTTALLYLGMTQNMDGGWGIGRGEDSHLMITAEVLRTLAACQGNFAGPQVLGAGVTWLLNHQNGDGGFSSVAGASNPNESSLAALAIRAADPAASLRTAATYLRNNQLPNGSWGDSPYLTAAAVQALRLPPVVSPIPGQTVSSPAPFATINLDAYVTDPDNTDAEITWSVSGNTQLAISIVNRVATITYPAGANLSEELTFTATDPSGFSGSATATFTVGPNVDYTIARGGFVTGSRIFTAASSVLDQAAYYDDSNKSNVPAGVTYATTSVGRSSATEMSIGFRINVGLSTAIGIHEFQVEYLLLDASSKPLGPLSGNVFNFRIQVTP